jgi:DNA-directed RNA polymerase specialized sigma24 family protein
MAKWAFRKKQERIKLLQSEYEDFREVSIARPSENDEHCPPNRPYYYEQNYDGPLLAEEILSTLSKGERFLVLKHLEGYSNQDLGDTLDRSREWVRLKLADIMIKLKQEFGNGDAG